MKDLGFFISPVGKLIPVGGNGTHIGTVIAHPSKFGLKKADIEKAYKKHKERLGIEGDAREEILKRLTKKGWIRLRRYPQYWSIQFARMIGDGTTRLRTGSYLNRHLFETTPDDETVL